MGPSGPADLAPHDMLDLVEAFRVGVAGRPMLIAAAVAIALSLARRLAAPEPARWQRWGLAMASVASGLALVAYLVLIGAYTADAHYFDAAEPTMPIVGWLFLHGQPIYHGIDAPARYAHMYGPAGFMAHAGAIWLWGPDLLTSKLVGAIAALVTLACTGLALRTRTSTARALVLTGSCALFFLIFRNYTFWTRPDPLQLASVAAALLVASAAPRKWAWIGVGVLTAALASLKITGPFYALPVLVVLGHRAGRRAVVAATLVAGLVATLPFMLPNVSFPTYLEWVRRSAETGLLLSSLRQNIEWAVFLLMPLLAVYYGLDGEARSRLAPWRHFVAALAVGLAAVAVAGAKPGAGPYHLLPFAPLGGIL